MSIDLDGINWHDGVLRDINVSGISGKRQGLELLLELYPGLPAQQAHYLQFER